jgi:hypothetical protein
MTTTVKYKLNMRGLDIIQTVYGLLLALGLREVFLAFYDIFKQPFSSVESALVAALLFLNIILLSLRFFWVPRNLRRLYFVSEYCRLKCQGAQADSASTEPNILPAYVTSWHIGVILLHGALYFLVCKEFEYYVFVSISYTSYSRTVFATYVFVHASLLIFNALWLISVNASEDAMRRKWLPNDDHPPFLKFGSESKIWYRNNLAFALLAIGPLAVFSACDSDLPACLSMAFPTGQPPFATISASSPFALIHMSSLSPFAVIPTSSLNIAFLFEYIAAAFSPLASRDVLLAVWAMAALIANSVIDLTFTAPRYIGLEEIEQEVVHTPRVVQVDLADTWFSGSG